MEQSNAVTELFGGQQTESLEKQVEPLAVKIALLDEKSEQLSEELSSTDKELTELKTNLATLMQQNNIESIKLANGLLPKVKTTVKFFKAAGIEDTQLFEWLNKNNMGDIIKPFVHFQILQSAVKQFQDQGGEIPAELLTVSATPTITMYGKSKFLAGRNENDQSN